MTFYYTNTTIILTLDRTDLIRPPDMTAKCIRCVCFVYSSVDLTPSDPRWVGAWWIGFIITAVCFILLTVPLTGFPKHLPGNDHGVHIPNKTILKL